MVVEFTEGLTALVGANDAGKTAVIDALRFALGTSDQERKKLEDSDFHKGSKEIRIVCKFQNLSVAEEAIFAEFLTHSAETGAKPLLYLNWLAEDIGQSRGGRAYYRVEARSGREGAGAHIPQEVKIFLNATYLRPLRDAEEALSAGRYSRLSQVLKQSPLFSEGSHSCDLDQALRGQDLSILGIAKLFTALLSSQKGVAETRSKINTTLGALSLTGDLLLSQISVSGANDSDEARLKEMLEKLDLRLQDFGKMGLGSDNLLFMSCELLLLEQERQGNRMLLIEEPEAHLHAQRQLQLIKALQTKAKAEGIQVIVTTHSPNLSSVIDLENLVMIRNRKAYSLSSGETELEGSDRGFLQRFLDVTKANLFFACGVVIVEGDAEHTLLPTIAKLIGKDFTSHGVSIVNVGGVGLGRYARIFKRAKPQEKGELGLQVACITDMDVMPDCAPKILGKENPDGSWPSTAHRRWRAQRDIGDGAALEAHRKTKCAKFDGQGVKTFVSDGWTLEYDLALGTSNGQGVRETPLAENVWTAIWLADEDEKICGDPALAADEEVKAVAAFMVMKAGLATAFGQDASEVLASTIYARFQEKISKPITAQYLATILQNRFDTGEIDAAWLRKELPSYLVDAIDYVTGGPVVVEVTEQP